MIIEEAIIDVKVDSPVKEIELQKGDQTIRVLVLAGSSPSQEVGHIVL